MNVGRVIAQITLLFGALRIEWDQGVPKRTNCNINSECKRKLRASLRNRTHEFNWKISLAPLQDVSIKSYISTTLRKNECKFSINLWKCTIGTCSLTGVSNFLFIQILIRNDQKHFLLKSSFMMKKTSYFVQFYPHGIFTNMTKYQDILVYHSIFSVTNRFK